MMLEWVCALPSRHGRPEECLEFGRIDWFEANDSSGNELSRDSVRTRRNANQSTQDLPELVDGLADEAIAIERLEMQIAGG
jgi:hypothetical protein